MFLRPDTIEISNGAENGRNLSLLLHEGSLVIRKSSQFMPTRVEVQQRTVTDPRGRHKLRGLQPGQYAISAERRGFRCDQLRGLNLPRRSRTPIDFGLDVGTIGDVAPIEIAGKVTWNGEPVHDATVTAVTAFNPDIMKQVRTDTEGEYVLQLLARGHYVIYASMSGFSVDASPFPSGDQKTLDFELSHIRSR